MSFSWRRRRASAKIFALVILGTILAGCVSPSEVSMPQLVPGIAVQDGSVQDALEVGADYAMTRWPASRCRLKDGVLNCPYLDQEIAAASSTGIKLMAGLMWQNETYTGAPSAIPTDWPQVCWGGSQPGCGPNYADPRVRSLAVDYVQGFCRRYGAEDIIRILNLGDDGERRFCKHPMAGDPCFEAYQAAGLTPQVWKRFTEEVTTAASCFDLVHYSGFGFAARELGDYVRFAVQAGKGLYSSGLYPSMCNGNSWGGQCNSTDPLLNDWQVPLLYSDTVPIVMEQSLAYRGAEAKLAWLWALSHGARVIVAQKATLKDAAPWQEEIRKALGQPAWVAWKLEPAWCQEHFGSSYCGEEGSWSNHLGWPQVAVERTGAFEMRTKTDENFPTLKSGLWAETAAGRMDWLPAENGTVRIPAGTFWVYEPSGTGPVTPEPTATWRPTPTPATPEPTSTVRPTPTIEPTAEPTPGPARYRVKLHILGKTIEFEMEVWKLE